MKKKEKSSGFKTLLLSVVLSSFGPFVLGYGLTIGHSTTQIADFTRRTAELLAIIVSFAVFAIVGQNDQIDDLKKKNIERKSNIFAGIVMCISGMSMLILAMLPGNNNKGNVLPAFVIALFGAITNSLFWKKYSSLYKSEKDMIIGVQARLYRAKSFVDICVTLSLLTVAALPDSQISIIADMIGSGLVSIYMLLSGIKTIRENTFAVESV